MISLRKILFPVDFSSRSQGAAHAVKVLVQRFGAEVSLIHVVEGEGDEQKLAAMRKELSDFAQRELGCPGVVVGVLEGDPAVRIIECARSGHFDLIVLPTHGYGPFRRFLLGSVAAKVLHDADCPVLTGTHMEQLPQPEAVVVQHVLCGVDFGPQSCAVLRWANEVAQQFGAKLTLAHAIPVFSMPPDGYWVGDWRAETAAAAEDEMQRLQQSTGVTCELAVVDGDPPFALGEAAKRLGAELLVIGRSHAPGLRGRLSANAYGIIARSPCPVLSV